MNPEPNDSTNPPAPEKDWASAPQPVKFARGAAFVGAAFSVLIFVLGLIAMGQPEGRIGGLFYTILGAVYLMTYLWLIMAIPEGKPEAWPLQRFVSIVGLLACPIGTILNGIILTQWNHPDVKAWFSQ